MTYASARAFFHIFICIFQIFFVPLHPKLLQSVSYMDFKILNFTIFCVNNVAAYLNKSAKDVYHAMQNAGMIDGYIVPCYDVLHSFSKEYIVNDLVSLMQQKGVKL